MVYEIEDILKKGFFYIFPWGGEKKRQVHITFSYKVYVVLTDSRKYSESDTYGF